MSRHLLSLASRRQLLSAAAVAGGWMVGRTVLGEERPSVTYPRSISSDTRSEPDWNERLTITVGQNEGDLVGSTDRVIQAAVDYVARLGGGTVSLGAGTWRMRNAIYMRPKVRVLGVGDDTTLLKEPSIETKLRDNADWYDQEITLADSTGFRVGDGVCLRTRNPHDGGTDIVKRTLVARDGDRFKLDRALKNNFWLKGDTTVSTLFPMFTGEEIADVTIERLRIDGNRAKNANLDGNHAGCCFFQDCERLTFRDVTAHHFNGDGFSWQICHDVTVENCRSHDHNGLGLHPGSGSQRPVMRGNQLRDCLYGIFFCWGVRYGLAEKNKISGCRWGVSIGHRDTDNLVTDNDIAGSIDVGVHFRDEAEKFFAGHRNRIVGNRLVDNGKEETSAAIDVQGETENVWLERNEVRETRGPGKRAGVRLGAKTKEIILDGNKFAGFATEVEDLRKA